MPFVKPEKRQEGTKFLVYGEFGSGKTPTGLSFPDIALIDSDSGTNFYNHDNVEIVTSSLSYKELEEDLDELEMDDEVFDSIKTFTVDSLTKFHETMSIAMNKVAERRAINNGREAEAEVMSFREYGKMKTYYEEFFSRMVKYAKLGKNLVFIAEQKDVTENKNGEMRKIGVAPSAQKGVEYDFDVVIRTFQEKTKVDGEEVMQPKGVVLKDRTGTYQVGQVIDKPNYDHWKDAVEGNQKGKKRTKDEVKTISEVANEEAEVLDDGETLRKNATAIIKGLTDKQKATAKEKLAKAIGTHEVHKVNDVKQLQKALKELKSIK